MLLTTRRLAVFAVLLLFSFTTNASAQNRMLPIPTDRMTAAQKKAAAEFEAARGALSGPWAVILRSPEMINRARSLSDYLRFNSSLPPRLSEFVILITAREWTQQY
jgi:4-carboxymuconolactone decarboxylase